MVETQAFFCENLHLIVELTFYIYKTNTTVYIYKQYGITNGFIKIKQFLNEIYQDMILRLNQNYPTIH